MKLSDLKVGDCFSYPTESDLYTYIILEKTRYLIVAQRDDGSLKIFGSNLTCGKISQLDFLQMEERCRKF